MGSGVGIVVTELLYQLEDPLKGQSTECVETEQNLYDPSDDDKFTRTSMYSNNDK